MESFVFIYMYWEKNQILSLLKIFGSLFTKYLSYMVKTNIILNFLVKSDWIWHCVDDPAYLNCSISIEF